MIKTGRRVVAARCDDCSTCLLQLINAPLTDLQPDALASFSYNLGG
ncbi:glycoside hydrolase family protein [Candidatus Bartonella washoeensis]